MSPLDSILSNVLLLFPNEVRYLESLFISTVGQRLNAEGPPAEVESGSAAPSQANYHMAETNV